MHHGGGVAIVADGAIHIQRRLHVDRRTVADCHRRWIESGIGGKCFGRTCDHQVTAVTGHQIAVDRAAVQRVRAADDQHAAVQLHVGLDQRAAVHLETTGIQLQRTRADRTGNRAPAHIQRARQQHRGVAVQRGVDDEILGDSTSGDEDGVGGCVDAVVDGGDVLAKGGIGCTRSGHAIGPVVGIRPQTVGIGTGPVGLHGGKRGHAALAGSGAERQCAAIVQQHGAIDDLGIVQVQRAIHREGATTEIERHRICAGGVAERGGAIHRPAALHQHRGHIVTAGLQHPALQRDCSTGCVNRAVRDQRALHVEPAAGADQNIAAGRVGGEGYDGGGSDCQRLASIDADAAHDLQRVIEVGAARHLHGAGADIDGGDAGGGA